MKKQIILTLVLSLAVLVVLGGAMAVAASQPKVIPTAQTEPTFMASDDGAADVSAQAALTDTISQYGITWTFDREYEYGQFANGDYWVIGPVTITQILPAFDGDNNGWEVNPVYSGTQGFDSFCEEFDDSLVPDLPYMASPGESIVKAVSNDDPSDYNCLQTAAVLTVVPEAPPDDGATVFRPPYVADEKPYYSVQDLHTELLPSLEPVDHTPTLAWVEEQFERVQLDHKGGALGRHLHPLDNVPDYGASIGRRNADGALRLMLNDPVSQKMPALIAYVQYGIDLYHMILNGQTWPAGGGHRPGQKLPMSLAAVLLDHQAMKNTVITATFFHEDNLLYHSENAGRALYGSGGYDFEENYWEVVASQTGYKSWRDPYGYIDGGPVPGEFYQYCCTSQPWKGSAIAVHLIPQMKALWTNEAFFDYVDRWVEHGVWSQPDPCAPYDGNWNNYGVTFGPDGDGGCIEDTNPGDGVGRFPDLHGTQTDEGHHASRFQGAMWEAYRNYRALELYGTPGDSRVHLNWTVNITMPVTSTWHIDYYTQTATAPFTITDPFSATRATVLTENVDNYQWYTVTLHAMVGETSWLSDTVRVMPTDKFVYLPLVLRGY
jgi:hypothetical protein